MIVIGCLILVIVGAGVVFFVSEWYEARSEADFLLKFSDFKKYYALNPGRYKFYMNPLRVYVNVNVIGFALVDYIQFCFWHKYLKKMKREKECNDNLEWYLQSVQEDIRKVRAESQRMQETAFNDLLKRSEHIELE